MLRRNTSLILVLVAIVSSFVLSGCPARRGGSPADLDPTFLDRA